MALSKDQILGASDLPNQTVPVPEWGGDVIIRTMTGAARDAYEASMVVFKDGQRVADLTNMRAKLVAATLVDDTGRLLFTAAEEVEALAAKSASVLERLFRVAQDLNGMGAASVEQAQKNSNAAPSGASPSA
ncbi:hypothetical protein [uncultured Ralstonia sp.]|jgi:hypothetical protein|uniref:hypothetical protein n=1 Tax=Ralstonia sp. TaxID=54061 RepID=UPI001EAABD4B|nr:hypothetical protein [uncultured Ralstonia sp.]UCF25463.1 MAG: hypothetical protein JSV72_08775 [Ralstonia sp.]